MLGSKLFDIPSYPTHNILDINDITFLATDNMYKCEKLYAIIRLKIFSIPVKISLFIHEVGGHIAKY